MNRNQQIQFVSQILFALFIILFAMFMYRKFQVTDVHHWALMVLFVLVGGYCIYYSSNVVRRRSWRDLVPYILLFGLTVFLLGQHYRSGVQESFTNEKDVTLKDLKEIEELFGEMQKKPTEEKSVEEKPKEKKEKLNVEKKVKEKKVKMEQFMDDDEDIFAEHYAGPDGDLDGVPGLDDDSEDEGERVKRLGKKPTYAYTPDEAQRATYNLISTVKELQTTMQSLGPVLRESKSVLDMMKDMEVPDMGDLDKLKDVANFNLKTLSNLSSKNNLSK